MSRLVVFLAAALLPAMVAPATAQPAPVPGTCTLGTAAAVLDIGDVSARVFNTGALFYGNGRANAYYVPRDSGHSPIYAADLWVGGKVDGELRVAGGTYGAGAMEYNLWPGPLGDDARPVDPDDCAAYDRIYTVSRADVQQYYATGVATPDLRDWPWQLGAPVLDGDGDPTNYDLDAGDQPALLGDQTAWSLTNDVGNVHPSQHTPPLGVEVRAEMAAFALGRLRQTTLYRYTLTNRTASTIDSMYVALWADPDLGDASDDLVGTDTTRGMVYTYNETSQDGTGAGTSYGTPAPAVGFQVAAGPVGLPNGRDDDGDGLVDESGERLGLTASGYSDLGNGTELFNLLRGRFKDGTVKREFGSGYNQSQGAVTPFAFAGDPVTGQPWSEVNPGAGEFPHSGGNRYSVASTGPFRLGPGQSETVTFAIPFGQGADNLDSITELRRVALAVTNAVDAGLLAPQRVDGFVATLDPTVRLRLPAPNPFTERAVVRYAMPAGTRMRATLHDVRGRQVAVLFDGATVAPEGEIVIDGSGLAAGVYRLRVTVPRGERFLTLVHAR